MSGTLVDSNVLLEVLTDTLPDFIIGAHAAAASLRLLTREARRY